MVCKCPTIGRHIDLRTSHNWLSEIADFHRRTCGKHCGLTDTGRAHSSDRPLQRAAVPSSIRFAVPAGRGHQIAAINLKLLYEIWKAAWSRSACRHCVWAPHACCSGARSHCCPARLGCHNYPPKITPCQHLTSNAEAARRWKPFYLDYKIVKKAIADDVAEKGERILYPVAYLGSKGPCHYPCINHLGSCNLRLAQ